MNLISIKVNNQGTAFLKKLKLNRIKVGKEEDLSYHKLFDLIVNYFKLNNEDYLKLLNMEMKDV